MSILKRNCKEVTRLVLAGEDRRLSLFERLLVRLHLRACRACPLFAGQVALMRRSLDRWRGYRNTD